jgi:hypothetical protein
MGEQPREEKGPLRLASEKATRILKDMNVHRGPRRDGERGRSIHDQRHFAEFSDISLNI